MQFIVKLKVVKIDSSSNYRDVCIYKLFTCFYYRTQQSHTLLRIH